MTTNSSHSIATHFISYCPSLVTQPCHFASSIGVDALWEFANAIHGVGPTITNESVSDIGLLCLEIGHERPSATAFEFLGQYSSPEERADREIVPVMAHNAAFGAEAAELTAQAANLTAQSSREIAPFHAVVIRLFWAKRLLWETIKAALEKNADRCGEMTGRFCPEMTWM
jgi:hypothetical protein